MYNEIGCKRKKRILDCRLIAVICMDGLKVSEVYYSNLPRRHRYTEAMISPSSIMPTSKMGAQLGEDDFEPGVLTGVAEGVG